jgi:predicted enzyme related to lactoylglutathione lyase
MINSISTVWLPVTDMDRAVTFYGDALGLELKENHGEWAELEVDGLTIGLNARAGEQPSPDGGAVIAFRAEDGLEAEMERLDHVEFEDGISRHPWGRVAVFHDPDGNSLQLFEPPAD